MSSEDRATARSRAVFSGTFTHEAVFRYAVRRSWTRGHRQHISRNSYGQWVVRDTYKPSRKQVLEHPSMFQR